MVIRDEFGTGFGCLVTAKSVKSGFILRSVGQHVSMPGEIKSSLFRGVNKALHSFLPFEFISRELKNKL